MSVLEHRLGIQAHIPALCGEAHASDQQVVGNSEKSGTQDWGVTGSQGPGGKELAWGAHTASCKLRDAWKHSPVFAKAEPSWELHWPGPDQRSEACSMPRGPHTLLHSA